MIKLNCYIACIVAFCPSLCRAQTVELLYESTNPNAPYREYFAYDYKSGAATRIDAMGNVRSVDPSGAGSSGRAGESALKPDGSLSFLNAKRMASIVMPQLIVQGIQSDPKASLVTEVGALGGPTYTGEYPTGNRLISAEDLKGALSVPIERVYYDFDELNRLAQMRYESSDRIDRFDLADSSTSTLSYVRTFGNGSWVLKDVRVTDNSNLGIFRPEYIADLARAEALELSGIRASSQSERAATPEGQRELERIRDEAIGTGLSQSTKRFALILTGLIVIAVGSIAWWKNRS